MAHKICTRYCVVAGCNSGDQMFGFPPARKKQWCENLGIDEARLTKRSCVCNIHFDENCFSKFLLKRTAIPTKLLGHNNAIPHTYLPPTMPKCIVCAKEKNLRNFPTDPELLRIWKQTLGIQGSPPCKELKVCLEHFPKGSMHHTKISRDCVPFVSSSLVQREILATRVGKHANQLVTSVSESSAVKRPLLSSLSDHTYCKRPKICPEKICPEIQFSTKFAKSVSDIENELIDLRRENKSLRKQLTKRENDARYAKFIAERPLISKRAYK